MRIRALQVEHTGANAVVTACGRCRINPMAGTVPAHWSRDVEGLVELVGANLAE